MLTFLELWLASLQVVVEGYERSYKHPDSVISDPAIDALLDNQHRVRLRKFRNTVFHVDFRDHPDARAVFNEYNEFTKWASSLTKGLGRIIVRRATRRAT